MINLTVVSREVAVSHVDSDALFALSLQSVEQQSVVNVVACVTHAFAVAFKCHELILIQLLTIENADDR